jgi:purine-binding chemotaxis protein CheW
VKSGIGGGLGALERGWAQRSEELLQLVAFRVGDGEYAVDIMRIKEIINPIKVRSIPKAPAFVEGVIELRGAILPVVDLRRRFDLPVTPIERSTKFLIVVLEIEGRRMIVALIVDGVSEPIRVTRDHLRPPPLLAQSSGSYFSAVIHYRGWSRDGAEPYRGPERRTGTAAASTGGEPVGGRRGRRRLSTRGPALPDEPTRRAEDRILMVVDLDAILSSTEKISLAHMAASGAAPAGEGPA